MGDNSLPGHPILHYLLQLDLSLRFILVFLAPLSNLEIILVICIVVSCHYYSSHLMKMETYSYVTDLQFVILNDGFDTFGNNKWIPRVVAV